MRIVTPQFQKKSDPRWELSSRSAPARRTLSIEGEWVECPFAENPQPSRWNRFLGLLSQLPLKLVERL